MGDVTGFGFLDEEVDLKYMNRIPSEPTRTPYIVCSTFFYLRSSSHLLKNLSTSLPWNNSQARGEPGMV